MIYTPANPDGVYRGPMNLRDAMAAGLLPPAAQVASVGGMEPIVRTARALGFNSLDASRNGLELLERGGAVSVLDTAYAYSVSGINGRDARLCRSRHDWRRRIPQLADPLAVF